MNKSTQQPRKLPPALKDWPLWKRCPDRNGKESYTLSDPDGNLRAETNDGKWYIYGDNGLSVENGEQECPFKARVAASQALLKYIARHYYPEALQEIEKFSHDTDEWELNCRKANDIAFRQADEIKKLKEKINSLKVKLANNNIGDIK